MQGSLKIQQTQYSKGTISISLVHQALSAAHEKGIDTTQVLEKVGISAELLASPKARISVSSFGQFWIELSNHLNDEFFAMDSHPMRRGSYQLISELVIHSQNLKHAIEHILKFFNAILDDLKSQLFVQENYAYIVINDLKTTKTMFCYATYMMLIHSLICWLTGQRISLKQIQLKCPAPDDDSDYKVRFCEVIKYDCDENYLQFDANCLNILIKQDHASWKQFIRQTPNNLLVRFKNPNSIANMIRKQLMQLHPSEWVEVHDLAQQLNLSEATFQRRLKAEGVSYQQLKNEIRRDTAIELLSKTSQSLQDISDELNFHDPSAFHRAFKKWTGVSPGAYRHSINQETDQSLTINSN